MSHLPTLYTSMGVWTEVLFDPFAQSQLPPLSMALNLLFLPFAILAPVLTYKEFKTPLIVLDSKLYERSACFAWPNYCSRVQGRYSLDATYEDKIYTNVSPKHLGLFRLQSRSIRGNERSEAIRDDYSQTTQPPRLSIIRQFTRTDTGMRRSRSGPNLRASN